LYCYQLTDNVAYINNKGVTDRQIDRITVAYTTLNAICRVVEMGIK